MAKVDQKLNDARLMFEQVKGRSRHPAKIKNLDLLWGVLEEMRSDKAEQYTLAEVGRRLDAAGGPKTQSLRNQQGADFREVVDAYAQAAKIKPSSLDSTQLEQAISLVPDPSARVVLKEYFAENKQLKHENDQLRSAFKSLSIGAVPSSSNPKALPVRLSPDEPRLELLDPVQCKLSNHARAALEKGFNAARLKERGLVVSANGAVVDDMGMQIFPPGFAQAIQEVLGGVL